jgi:hypothetical protein
MTLFNVSRDTILLLDPTTFALFKNSIITALSTSLDNYSTISSDLSKIVFMLVTLLTRVLFLINDINSPTFLTAASSALIYFCFLSSSSIF